MSISASQVKELREMSGVGMMECKKALVETDGDLQKALDLLRANSSLKAEKKASRVAADGAVKIADNSAYTSLVEINSETDLQLKILSSKILQLRSPITYLIIKSTI